MYVLRRIGIQLLIFVGKQYLILPIKVIHEFVFVYYSILGYLCFNKIDGAIKIFYVVSNPEISKTKTTHAIFMVSTIMLLIRNKSYEPS